MKAPTPAGIAKIRSNMENNKKQREDSLKASCSEKPLEERKTKRKQANSGEKKEPATRLAQRARALSLDVCFLDLARAAASTVGRVLHNTLGWQGTGFMISDRLFVTNNHVIRDSPKAEEFFVEFNYELDVMKVPKPVTRFALAPNDFFMSSPKEDLDFTIVALGSRVFGKGKLSDFGFCPIKDTENKHELGMLANIVGHPEGQFKQMAIRSNRIVAWNDEVLQYYTKAKVGSSGSPVFNDDWEPIALHHWGCPTRTAYTTNGKLGPEDTKEGIRISAIVKRINSEKNRLSQKQRALIDGALGCPFRQPSLLKRL
jgi:endonuclease G